MNLSFFEKYFPKSYDSKYDVVEFKDFLKNQVDHGSIDVLELFKFQKFLGELQKAIKEDEELFELAITQIEKHGVDCDMFGAKFSICSKTTKRYCETIKSLEEDLKAIKQQASMLPDWKEQTYLEYTDHETGEVLKIRKPTVKYSDYIKVELNKFQ